MSQEQAVLAVRVTALETRVADLAAYLRSALEYLSSDPQSSLTKSRVILEKLLLTLYRSALKKEPARPMIGEMLADKAFTTTIPRRIVARMNAIRDMSNLGPHGEEVDAADAIRVMRDLVDVLDWYVVKCDPCCLIFGARDPRYSLEILPQLRGKYPRYLRPEIVSVKLIQSEDRCYLEMTTAEAVSDDLVNETSKRIDLAFIAGGSGNDDRLFRPTTPITENAHYFVSEFDEFSIINCTDLFSPEAADAVFRAEVKRRGENICEGCGCVYSVRELYEDHESYFDGPYNYCQGSARYCLECWLGVGPNDIEDLVCPQCGGTGKVVLWA